MDQWHSFTLGSWKSTDRSSGLWPRQVAWTGSPSERAALAEIIDRTGVSISEAIKTGLVERRNSARKMGTKSPSEFFASFEFGEGGYSIAPARYAKAAIKAKLKNKLKN